MDDNTTNNGQDKKMKLTRREFLVGASIAAATAALAACGQQPTPTTAPPAQPTSAPPPAAPTSAPAATATTAAVTSNTPKDKIVGAFGLDIDDLDPQYFKSIPGYQTVGNVYELLQNYDLAEDETGALVNVKDETGNWKFLPGLAESLTVSDDRKTVTIKLRQDAKFSDGSPITVDDWMYTFNRALTGEGYAKILLGMLTVDKIDQIKAVDASTLQFNLNKAHPFADKLLCLNVVAPLKKDEVEKHKTDKDPTAHDWLKANVTANGAYVLKSWTPGVGWEMEPNPNYWDKASLKNQGVVYKVIPNAQDRLSLLKRGDVDLAHDIAPKDLAEFKSDPNLKIFDFKIPWPFYFGLNTKLAPFDKKEVRQAIAYATPYQTIIDKVMYGFAKPLKSPIAEGMPGSDYSFWKYDTDLNKAKQLLDQAGVKNLSFEIGMLLGRAEDEQTAVWIQSSLAQIGVDMKINKMTDAQFYDLYNKHQLQSFITEWYSWVNDPLYHVYWHFLSTNTFTNATQYSNPKVDELITNGMYETDGAKRADMVKQIQQIVVDDCPWVFLYQKDWTIAARKNVMHYPWITDTVGRFKYTYKT
jgi:peptide/nickel transport system substrate-binding protein